MKKFKEFKTVFYIAFQLTITKLVISCGLWIGIRSRSKRSGAPCSYSVGAPAKEATFVWQRSEIGQRYAHTGSYAKNNLVDLIGIEIISVVYFRPQIL